MSDRGPPKDKHEPDEPTHTNGDKTMDTSETSRGLPNPSGNPNLLRYLDAFS